MFFGNEREVSDIENLLLVMNGVELVFSAGIQTPGEIGEPMC